VRAVIQRVQQNSVTVNEAVIANIGQGLLVLLGVAQTDQEADADFMADKIVHLRIFEDELGKMNRSLQDIGGDILVVSQFTLLGDCRKGRRPSFIQAAGPQKANALYERFVQQVRRKGVNTATGQFRTMMAVSLVNDGPVTLIVESR
jgi:D-aminoacyl-tRNA deacylase